MGLGLRQRLGRDGGWEVAMGLLAMCLWVACLPSLSLSSLLKTCRSSATRESGHSQPFDILSL